MSLLSLVPEYDDSLSSTSSNEDNSSQEIDRQSEKASLKLPKPDFNGNSDSDSVNSSVFKNPFVEAENAKEAILQKHVKMVDATDNVVVINGRKICWNYRKGRCRFGHNCKYAHDSDVQKSTDQLESRKQMIICQKQTLPEPPAQELEKIQQEFITLNTQKRKKRPGLTQGLVPGKKVMKNYINQK